MRSNSTYPASDESVRNKHAGELEFDDIEATQNLQTSHKDGKHSAAEKLGASRPESGTGRGALPVDGAFGREQEQERGGPKGK